MSNNFQFYAPTKVIFGKGTESQVGALVKGYNCKKVLLHYGSGSVKKTGLLDRIKKSLDDAQISYVELGGVVPNPRLSLVREEIALKGIEATEQFFRDIQMPTNMRELGITPTDEQIAELAKKCAITTGNNLGSAKVLHEEDMKKIYEMSR